MEPNAMYCWSCGHKNPDDNRFCGQCGKVQVRPPVLVESDLIDDKVRTLNPPAQERRSRRDHEVERAETAQRIKEKQADAEKVERPKVAARTEPVTQAVAPPPGTGIIPTPRSVSTNPLIGEPRVVKESPLPTPPVSEPARAMRSEYPANRISGPSFLGLSDAPDTSDYLLDDEASEPSSTARSYVFLALLLLFGVLIYKQWDTVSAFGRDLARTAKATAPSSIPERTPPQDLPAPAATNNEIAANANDKAERKPESDQAAPATATSDAEGSTANPDATEEDAVKKETSPVETKAQTGAEKGGAAEEATRPIVTDDSQLEAAQKYLQGRGVAQDCGRGVSLLRSAAAQPNPKAQIKLGALYATGHCVAQDKAEAYRWFAQAHQLQPGNPWIDKSLNSLWAEMTTEERARAQR